MRHLSNSIGRAGKTIFALTFCLVLLSCVSTSKSGPVQPDVTVPESEEPPTKEILPETDAPAPLVADADGVLRQQVGFDALPGWDEQTQIPALLAFLGSCKKLTKATGQTNGNTNYWGLPCAQARKLQQNPAGLSKNLTRQFFEAWFTPFALSLPNTDQGLLTGYYEPELPVRAAPDLEYSEPILARPDDLVTVSLRRMDPSLPDKKLVGRVSKGQLQPYYSRGEIRQSTGKPLAWGRPIDVFFLQVQGSGRIRFAGGATKRAAFAGHNGLRYSSIGRELINRGELTAENASKKAIENWMQQAGPTAAQQLMNTNRRYIFFESQEILNSQLGPKGTQGVALTARASLAIDPRFHAFGSPIWIAAKLPENPKDWRGKPTQFLAIAQDTGGAIKGALRGDLFFGSGTGAGALAGIQKHSSRWWTLMPNQMAKQRKNSS
ncbi:MAG: murein transglycosylase [Robiginitomaculum sp.]|nr:MAG: murein transglycosylase [Robiginitomaculum sp.]